MGFSIDDVIDLCKRKNIRVVLSHLEIGDLTIDKTGIIGRGHAAIAPADAPMQSDDVIANAAENFNAYPAEGAPLPMNRDEFVEYLRT